MLHVISAHVLHMICTRLHPGHLSVRVRDSLWCSKEIIQISNCAVQCEYCCYYFFLILLGVCRLHDQGWLGDG